MDKLELGNYYVKGFARNNNNEDLYHAWNMVEIDGKWYHLDVTWAFPKSSYGLTHKYNFFLLSDSEFFKRHTPDNKADLPEAYDTSLERLPAR